MKIDFTVEEINWARNHFAGLIACPNIYPIFNKFDYARFTLRRKADLENSIKTLQDQLDQINKEIA